MTLSQLKRKHPRLIYQDFAVKQDGKNLSLSFSFLLEPDIRFRPEIVIPAPPSLRGRLRRPWQSLVFHLGMIEALSYWKAACPPELVVKAGYLSPDQIAWWKHLFIHGLGEFFFRNNIDFTTENFLTITCKDQIFPKDLILTDREGQTPSGDLILVGGGKDSIVTLETLKNISAGKTALMLNPGPNSVSAARIAGYQNPIIVTRIIDPKLLQLNKLGYLNGHTPFSAYLAFLGVLVAYLHGYKNVISSNELGAGEASLIYKSMEINHQYSKSFAFEKEFRGYCRRYLSQNANYFSYLRPFYELQIARIFANLPSSRASPSDGRSVAISSGLPRRYAPRNDDNNGKYDSVFVSCNAGRGEFWCGRCPKCAFNYLSLFPFMSAERLENIFKSDLFEIPEIQKHILDLVGLGRYKPFDCVGTKDESILAAALAVKKLRAEGKPVPEFLLRVVRHSEAAVGGRRIPSGTLPRRQAGFAPLKMTNLEKQVMENWSDQHFLPSQYSKLLKKTG